MRSGLFAIGLSVTLGCGAALSREAPPIDAYLGHYPYEEVGGIAFLDHPQVLNALNTSGLSQEDIALIRRRDVTTIPIFRTDAAVVAFAFDPASGGSVNWFVALTPDGARSVVCFSIEPDGYLYEDGRRIGSIQPAESGCADNAEEVQEQLRDWPS